jgi:hypothetical protein
MPHRVPKSPRRRKAVDAPLFALACVAAVIAEAITARLLWEYEADHFVAVLYSLLNATFAFLGVVVAGEAAKRKADPRLAVRRKAFAARLVSLALILPSAFIGGGAMALKMQDRAAIEYANSAAYAEQKELANSDNDHIRQQAVLDMERAIRPTQVRFADPAYVGGVIAFLAIMLLPVMATGAGLHIPAETPAQMKARMQAAKSAKAAATRAANKAAKEDNVLPMRRRA